MEATRSELEVRMSERVRRHLLTTFGGFVLAMMVAGLLGFVGWLAFGAEGPPVWLRVAPVLPIFLVPIIGIYSTVTNLRCPSCQRNVAMQVNFTYSPFSGLTKKTCNGCGAKIFADDVPRRLGRVWAILFAIGIAVGVLSSVLHGLSGH